MPLAMGQIFTVSVPLIGTLTGDNYVDFKMPFGATLIAVSADGDTQDFTFEVGTVADANAYVNTTDGAVTAGTITLLDAAGDFVGDAFHNIPADTLVRVTYINGSNSVDVFILLWFAIG